MTVMSSIRGTRFIITVRSDDSERKGTVNNVCRFQADNLCPKQSTSFFSQLSYMSDCTATMREVPNLCLA